MKLTKTLVFVLAFTLLFSSCQAEKIPEPPQVEYENLTEITLTDSEIKVNGTTASKDTDASVYTANDIVYYESGKDFTYGEGTLTSDMHDPADAAAHTVVHITKAGNYKISGTLSRGQIAVDLGDGAKNDENAVVTLILSGVDINCDVAPAIIFYNVYECGNTDTATATKDVDTSRAGANVIIADDTENSVRGAYVARIYKPDSVVLSEDGTSVVDAKKLHKYDGAFYSKMSMNVGGEKDGSGVLTINAANEGLGSELHLTINGGTININSGNDGINTNEDGVSVTTVNGGTLNINVGGTTGEGDGIDSNGWLVINGGTVIASAYAKSADAGIDSDMGIHINGGTVIAAGSMLDRIEDGGQNYAVFNFISPYSIVNPLILENEAAKTVMLSHMAKYQTIVFSSPDLKAGIYTLRGGETQLLVKAGTENMQRPGMPGEIPGDMPDGETPPELPEGFDPSFDKPQFDNQPPKDGELPPDGQRPEDGAFPPNGFDKNETPKNPNGIEGDKYPMNTDDYKTEFEVVDGGNNYSVIAPPIILDLG